MAKGAAAYAKHLRGEHLSFRAAIQAKCYDCMGAYADGPQDCKLVKCPLYPYHPYRTPLPSETAKKPSSRRGNAEALRAWRERGTK